MALDFFLKKVLIKKIQFPCSAVPSANLPQKARARCVKGGENIALSKNFFRIFSGKGLTERKANVLLEIFPLAGSGSLKFTLCD